MSQEGIPGRGRTEERGGVWGGKGPVLKLRDQKSNLAKWLSLFFKISDKYLAKYYFACK